MWHVWQSRLIISLVVTIFAYRRSTCLILYRSTWAGGWNLLENETCQPRGWQRSTPWVSTRWVLSTSTCGGFRMLPGEGSWEISEPGRDGLRGNCSQELMSPGSIAPRRPSAQGAGVSREILSQETYVPQRRALHGVLSLERITPCRRLLGGPLSEEPSTVSYYLIDWSIGSPTSTYYFY